MTTKSKTGAHTVEYLNADGTFGGRLDEAKYNAVKKSLLKHIPKSKQGVEFRALAAMVARDIPRDMQPKPGSASWLTTTVKLDLEARNLIERIEGSKPQRVRRVK